MTIEGEASVIFMRQLRRLKEETLDLMRAHVHQVDGTFAGSIYNSVMKSFLHDRIGKALWEIRDKFRIDELPPDNLWVRVCSWIGNYLDVLPDSIDQAIVILYETLDRDRINQLIMNTVPSDVEISLKMLSGGRWHIEVMEAKLVKKCEGSV